MTVLPLSDCDGCGRKLVEVGTTYDIEAALDRDGKPLAVQFLEKLASGKDHEQDLLADALVRLETFARTGELIVPRELNELRGGLWEVKVHTLRLPFYYRLDQPCGRVRLTHGFIKKSKKTPRKEIDLGVAIIREDEKHDGL